MSYELIALLMFASMALLLITGQRVFAAIGFVAAGAALLLYGNGAVELPYNQVFKLFNWYAMLTLPMFIYMGYILAESGIAEDLYKMMHVWFGRLPGGLAVGTILVMVIIASNTRLAAAGSGSAMPSVSARGVICHDTPQRSLHQPQALACPPLFTMAFHSRSVSAWSSVAIWNEKASVCLN